MTPETEVIPVVLQEELTITVNPINTETNARINQIVSSAAEIVKLRQAKEAQKIAATRQMQNTVIAMLENPMGLTSGNLLAASEGINLASVLGRLRAYLRTNNLYTLKKRREKKESLYYLDHVR